MKELLNLRSTRTGEDKTSKWDSGWYQITSKSNPIGQLRVESYFDERNFENQSEA